MRSTDERMDEAFSRARKQEAASRRRRQRAVAIGGGAVSVLALIAVGVGMSAVPMGSSVAHAPLGLMGSVFADSPAVGYIVVGLLGMALGIAVTSFIHRVGKASGVRSGLAEKESDDTDGNTEGHRP